MYLVLLAALVLKSLLIYRTSTTQAGAVQASLPGSTGEPQLCNMTTKQHQLGPDPVPLEVNENTLIDFSGLWVWPIGQGVSGDICPLGTGLSLANPCHVGQ